MVFDYRLRMFILATALIRIESYPTTTVGAQNADACGLESLILPVTDDPDVFSSPAYPTNTTCTWKLVAAAGKRINITSDFIDLERSTGCRADHLFIYDGDNELSQVLGRFCGKTPISVITSSNNALVKLVSDNSYTGVGFNLSFSATDRAGETQRVASPVYCNSTFRTSPGLITSPNFPLPTDVNTYCQYTFKAPEGKQVELVFKVFRLEQSTDCQYDHLEIFDGANEGNDSIGDYCGYDTPPLVRSSGRDLLVTYTTDRLHSRGGFNASYQFVSPDQDPLRLSEGHADCSQLIENETILSSPGFPGYYQNNKVCVYVLRAPPGQFVQVTFDVFKMEKKDHCKPYDYLAIYDGSSYELSASHIFCGEQVLPGTAFTSKGREYRLKFHSDGSVIDLGFLLNVTFVSNTTGTVCPLQCENEGESVQQQLGPMCDCPRPYSGDRCQTVPSDCGSDPCLNGGTCQGTENSFKCICQDGITGDYCQFNGTEKLEFDGPITVKSSLLRGEEALLECSANKQGAHFEWIYDDDIRLEKDSNENVRRSIEVFDGGLLRILALGQNNTGKYTCVVTAGAERIEQYVNVTIYDEPCDFEVDYPPENATGIIGGKLHMKCLANSRSKSVTHTWLKDDGPLPGKSNYEVLNTGHLQIRNLTNANAGKFTCEVMSDKCAKRYTAYLTVVGDTNLNKVSVA